MELLCPAGSLPALKTAIDGGADAVYIGLKDDTNARHFAGLNFNDKKMDQGAQYVRDHNKKLHVAINTFAHPGGEKRWFNAVDKCADLGANAAIIADIATLDYAVNKHPDLELHLSVQASATNTEAIKFYQENFNVQRVVLPRVLSLQQVKQLSRSTDMPLEVFAFGSLCIMAEGRCYLSSYFTGESPNTVGACSPAKYVRYQKTENGLETRLNDILIDRYKADDKAGYPTLCKGKFNVEGNLYHAIEEPTSLNTLSMLPALMEANICAVKIEGRQRSPAYVEQITRVWREAIDSYRANPAAYRVKESWDRVLANVSEGTQTTLGAYHRDWQ
ncbi:protease [Psychromonas sp. MB-3u-54]|uniref:ubiquinone anaerobic biosynthesis protein UbiU n=1 Tax=Psychromonas sp. MB-3u-54 TaxID=2058319 RepID=UPI000C331859|nr:peptidase U32 family protein [Psychromonas sp. MB-3u-54]PKH01020.1 protease [Psychromonas sp. MB-3u-54]